MQNLSSNPIVSGPLIHYKLGSICISPPKGDRRHGGERRLEINATLTHISNHPPKLEIHTSFLRQKPLFLKGRRLMGSSDRQFEAAPALCRCSNWKTRDDGARNERRDGWPLDNHLWAGIKMFSFLGGAEDELILTSVHTNLMILEPSMKYHCPINLFCLFSFYVWSTHSQAAKWSWNECQVRHCNPYSNTNGRPLSTGLRVLLPQFDHGITHLAYAWM